jgi:WD40 repeat protein
MAHLTTGSVLLRQPQYTECIIEGHSEWIWSLACVETSPDIISASEDDLIREWTRDGKPVGNLGIVTEEG